MTRKLMLFVGLVGAVVALGSPGALGKGAFPTVISLPNAWLPEGIATKGHTFYAGSRANGAIYRGDLRTGQGAIFIPGVDGRVATGLKADHGRLFVSGASTGKAFVFDLKTGALIKEYQLAAPGASFINDVVVTKKAAYFTDSSSSNIFKVALSGHGTPADTAQTIALSGGFQSMPGFNLNGIEATKNGKTLIAVQTNTGFLYTIDPGSGAATKIDAPAVVNGDGILLHGRTLYVVQNFNNHIAVVKLSHDLATGTLTRTITDPGFDIPTTVAAHGKRLYAVNARFSTPPTPATTYTIVQVKR
jgi:outer membrane protein assembly factor BamB